jgi:hypothetical protein
VVVFGHITVINWLKPQYRQFGFPPAEQPSDNPDEQPGSRYWGSATLPIQIYVVVIVEVLVDDEVVLVVVLVVLILVVDGIVVEVTVVLLVDVAVVVDDRILAPVLVMLVDEVVEFGFIELVNAVKNKLLVSRKNIESVEFGEPFCLYLKFSFINV